MRETQQDAWRVLLVGNDEEDYILTRTMLGDAQSRKVIVEWAPSYQAGLQMLGSNDYQAVLVDYDLGARNGIELIREAVAQGCPSPLILYTGRGTYEADVEAMEAGATLYLAKNEATSFLLERSLRYAIERKQAEQQIHYQASLLENVSEAIISTGLDFTIRTWNKAAEGMYGWPAGEAVGRITNELLKTEYLTARREDVVEEFRKNGAWRGEVIQSRRDGSPVHVLNSTSLMKDERGNPTAVVAVNRDISDHKRAEEALRQANETLQNQAVELEVQAEDLQTQTEELDIAHEKLRASEAIAQQQLVENEASAAEAESSQAHLEAIFAAQQDIVLFYDPHMNVRMANPAFQAIYGFDPVGFHIRDIIQRVACRLLDGRPLLIEEQMTPRALRGEKVAGARFLVRRGDGTDGVVETSSGPVRVGSAITGSVTVWHDITAQVRAEDRTRQQNAALAGISRIFHEALTCQTEEELGRVCLAVAEEVTHSKFGFIGEINRQTGRLDDIAISDPGWEACRIEGGSSHGKRNPMGFLVHGIYGRVLQDGKGFFTNDPASHPDCIGTPPGHPPLKAFLGVPLTQGGKTIGMVGLGNREGGYRQEDWEAAETLAPAIVQAFLSKRAEQALRRYELLSAHSRDMVLYLQRDDGRILEANQAAVKAYGYSYEELRGLTVKDLRASGTQPLIASQMIQADAGGILFETIHKRKDGTTFPVEVSSQGATIGGVRTLISVIRDITGRKRAEEELRRAYEHTAWLARFPDENPNPVARIGSDGTVLYHNPAAAKLPGWELKEGGALPDQIFQLVNQAMLQGIEVQQDIPLVDRIYSISVMPFSAEHYANLYGRDVTGRKQAEAALEAYAKQLQRSNQALEDFAFIASHDLQEPLRKVQAFGDRLQSRYSQSLDEQGRDYIERMQQATGRMQSMLDGLLAYARLATQGKPFGKVDLKQVVAEILSDLEVRIMETGGQVEIEDLPVIDADPVQMRQLLQNLIGNALKFHRPGVPPVVKVSWKPASQSEIELIVKDNGIGFDMGNAHQLFKPFHRLHGRSEYEGTGMGLAICRKIVELHGGTISAQSVPGEGSTFTVTLPKVHHQA